jgi:DNA-binding transcriptional ArsR family regulator
MRRDVFQAIADPTRREILSLLTSKDLKLNDVADKFRISRPAVSKHIKILNECGLLKINQHGRERFCRINPEPLKEVYNWVQFFDKFWDEKLSSLKNFLENNNA